MKARLVRVGLFHADRRTDMTTLIVAFRNFANAPKKEKLISGYVSIRLCQYQAMSVSDYVSIRLCQYQAMSVSGYVGIRLCRYQAMSVSGYVSIRLCQYQAMSVSGYVSIRLCQYQAIPSCWILFGINVTPTNRPSLQ